MTYFFFFVTWKLLPSVNRVYLCLVFWWGLWFALSNRIGGKWNYTSSEQRMQEPFYTATLTSGTPRRCHENKPKLSCRMLGDMWPSCPFTSANRELITREISEAILHQLSPSQSTMWLATEGNHRAQPYTEESPSWAQPQVLTHSNLG